MGGADMPTPRPLMSYVDQRSPDECWPWLGRTGVGGYGEVTGTQSRKFGTRMAHRAVYLTLVGAIPDGLELDHLCFVAGCVNPAHLEPVTHLENMRRRYARITACNRGHEYNDSNTRYLERDGQQLRVCRVCERENQRACTERRRRQQVRGAA